MITAHRRCAKKVARGQPLDHSYFKLARWSRAQNLCASPMRKNVMIAFRYQTFDAWLPSRRGSAAKINYVLNPSQCQRAVDVDTLMVGN